jgi:peptide/nickel transport system substrate-binding protein
MQIVAGIARKWEYSDDLKTLTYTIMEGGKFHDGSDITMDDVFWSLTHAVGPQAGDYGSSVAISFSRISEKVEMGPGPRQVSVTAKVPIPEVAVYWSENEGGASSGQIMPARPLIYSQEQSDAYNLNPIGAGPLALKEHIPQTSMLFERHDEFYYQPDNGYPTDKRIKFAEMMMTLVPEEAIRVAALATGEGDIGRASKATFDQVTSGGGRIVFSPESVIIESYLFGCYDPALPCHDKGVRQALNYAINKEVMRDGLFGSEVFKINGFWIVTESTIGYQPDLDPFGFDPVKARELFTAAGFKNPDNPGGKDFGTMVLNTYPDPLLPNLIEAARMAAANWEEELGLDVEVNVLDKVTYGKIRTKTPEVYAGQAVWVAQNTRMDGAGITRAVAITSQRESEFNAAFQPATRIHNDPEIFDMLKETMLSTGQATAEEDWHAAYVRMRDEAYHLSLGYVNAPWGVGPRILTWEPFPVCEYACAYHTITIPQ